MDKNALIITRLETFQHSVEQYFQSYQKNGFERMPDAGDITKKLKTSISPFMSTANFFH